jgi:hypothetical protein
VTPAEYLRANPGASRKTVMRACDCSARAVRRAEEELQLGEGRAKRLLSPALLGAGALLLALVVAAALWARSTPDEKRQLSVDEEIQAQEAAIYSALNLRDKSRAPEISQHLTNPEESLRLAALRFVAAVDPEPYLDRLLPLVDDESPRVRSSAVQLLGAVAPSEALGQGRVTAVLMQVLVDPQREVAERLLAIAGLERRTPADVRQVLPALDDARLSKQVADLLAQWTGKIAVQRESETLRAAWKRELGAG